MTTSRTCGRRRDEFDEETSKGMRRSRGEGENLGNERKIGK